MSSDQSHEQRADECAICTFARDSSLLEDFERSILDDSVSVMEADRCEQFARSLRCVVQQLRFDAFQCMVTGTQCLDQRDILGLVLHMLTEVGHPAIELELTSVLLGLGCVVLLGEVRGTQLVRLSETWLRSDELLKARIRLLFLALLPRAVGRFVQPFGITIVLEKDASRQQDVPVELNYIECLFVDLHRFVEIPRGEQGFGETRSNSHLRL